MNFDPLTSTLVFALIATACLGVGAPLVRWLGVSDSRSVRLLWSIVVGFTAATTLLTIVGLLGLLHSGSIIAATVVAALVGCWELWNYAVELRRDARSGESSHAERDEGSGANEPPPRLLQLLVAAAVVASIASFASATAPPTAGDALCYHLELPKRFLAAGQIDFRPDDDNITYPLLAEMGFLWALAFGTPAVAALLQWGFGLALTGSAYLLARPYVGERWAVAAAAVVILTPGVNNQMTAPLNDVVFAAFCALALAAWDVARRQTKLGPYALVGIMLGAAMGTKLPALIFGAVLAVAWLAVAFDDMAGRRRMLHGAVCALAVCLSIVGVWYARSAWHRGDPVYPFLSQSAGGTAPATLPESKAPLGRGLPAVVAAPWAMTMQPDRFGGRAHQWGPLFLMLVPIAAVYCTDRSMRRLLFIASAYAAACILLRQNLRFLLPVVPVFAAAAALAGRHIASLPTAPRIVAAAAVSLVVVFQTAVPVARLRHTLSTFAGWETGEAYLARYEPTFVAAAWINEHLPPEAVILSQEQRAFYLTPHVTRESVFRRRVRYDEASEVDGLAVAGLNAAALRRQGITHLLAAEAEGSPTARFDATLSRLIDASVASQRVDAPTLVNQWRHRDPAGDVRHYRLYSLD